MVSLTTPGPLVTACGIRHDTGHRHPFAFGLVNKKAGTCMGQTMRFDSRGRWHPFHVFTT
jgi:hypothetical protein